MSRKRLNAGWGLLVGGLLMVTVPLASGCSPALRPGGVDPGQARASVATPVATPTPTAVIPTPTAKAVATVPAPTSTPTASVPTPTPSPRPAADLTEASLKNVTYDLSGIGSFALSNGNYEKKTGEGATQVIKVGFQTAALGDLNQDGARDAAVILWANTGGSGTFVYLVAVVNQNGTARQMAAQLLGDRVKINSLSVADGKIVVSMVGFGPQDPLCCPSQKEVRTYQLEGNTLK